MQRPLHTFCKEIGKSPELSEFQHVSKIGYNLYNTFACGICLLLNIPVSLLWYYYKLGAIGNYNNSAMK